MALKNKLTPFLLLICNLGFAKMYPELMAKQANDNIRFISADGKYTYYQKRSGSLHFSRNYKILDVLKGNIGTQYTIIATESRKKMIITQNQNFHTFLSMRMKEMIYVMNFGDATPREIGPGTSPALHLNDDWISYYDPYSKVLNFEHTTNYALKFSIKLNNRINPYFIPQVIMLDENSVYYTDLGENGNFGLIEYKRNNGQSEIIYKATNPTTKFEINNCQGKFIFSEMGIAGSDDGSKISIVPSDIKKFSDREKIYNSNLNDLGHVTCDFNTKNIYFIKNTGNKIVPSYDMAEIDTTSKTLNILTDMKNVSSIINMDGIVLTTDKGKYLIIKGENDYKTVDSLKLPNKATPNKEEVKK